MDVPVRSPFVENFLGRYFYLVWRFETFGHESSRRFGSQNGLLVSLGHDHSDHEVIAAVRNPGLPHENRPFHCPDCPMTYRPNRKDAYWDTYKTIAEAKEAGQERACIRCFPRRVTRGK